MGNNRYNNPTVRRREFLMFSAVAGANSMTFAKAGGKSNPGADSSVDLHQNQFAVAQACEGKIYNAEYSGNRLNRIAFPMGGIGAGMICLEGSGALSHVLLHHHPEMFNEPCSFAAISICGKRRIARVLEGPVPSWKLFGLPGAGSGCNDSSFGLRRFDRASFTARFPFATITLSDNQIPLQAEITGWSPFAPNEADDASLPVAGLEYRFTNYTAKPIEVVFSFNAKNFMAIGNGSQAVKAAYGGFVLHYNGEKDKPWQNGDFSATVDAHDVKVNHAWFRGGWFDSLTMAWNDISSGACFNRPPLAEGEPSPGATLFVPLQIAPKASKIVVLRLAWYVNCSNLRIGEDPSDQTPLPMPSKTYRPWYAGKFADIEAVTAYWCEHYDALRRKAKRFSDCFYDSTLPPEVIEAVAANLTILKSPTVLRQADGRFWAWEGCNDHSGSCYGTCTHVWNYAQALPHLFPALERTLRETEFGVCQDERGHQTFRASLPIRPAAHDFHAAADGQLGGIMKVYREWRVSGDNQWLHRIWPKVKASLDYCIETWDPRHDGLIAEPHHNTYDIEFWGPDSMCTSFYLGALQAAILMGKALGNDISLYATLLDKGIHATEKELFNGEYFFQKVKWKTLRAKDPMKLEGGYFHAYSPEAQALLKKEGPKYQYGNGCLSDGVLGSWMAMVCGMEQVLDNYKVASHLKAVHCYNLKKDLSGHANPQRPGFACGSEGGLLLCTWPKGDMPSLPFIYSNEVWTGVEYQVASYLMMTGRVEEGLEIVRICRDRYDGRTRNPFNEYECGHWYARAMSSYALLQGMSGVRYDAVEKTLYLQPGIDGDFRCFISTATGYGTVGVKNGKAFLDVCEGKIDVCKTVMKKGLAE